MTKLFTDFFITCVSQGDRYLGMTAAMTQIPVPTAIILNVPL